MFYRKGCRYWTWHHEGAGDFAFRCVVMEDILNTAAESKERKEESPYHSMRSQRERDTSEDEDEMQKIRRKWKDKMFKEGVPTDFDGWRDYKMKEEKDKKEMWTMQAL